WGPRVPCSRAARGVGRADARRAGGLRGRSRAPRSVACAFTPPVIDGVAECTDVPPQTSAKPDADAVVLAHVRLSLEHGQAFMRVVRVQRASAFDERDA